MTATIAKATTGRLSRLWRVVLASLLVKVSGPKPSAEILQEARKFLACAGYAGPRHSPKVIKQYQALHAAYMQALKAALATEHPSASILAEVRVFLWQNQITLDSQSATSERPSQIPAASVPFKNLH